MNIMKYKSKTPPYSSPNRGGREGFTLLEVLTVISILGILAVLLINTFGKSLMKGNDHRRKQGVEAVKNALEIYYNDNEAYPTTNPALTGGFPWGSSLTNSSGIKVYMKKLPQDPKSSSGYNYVYQSDGTAYRMYTCLENSEDFDYNKITPTLAPNCGAACSNTCYYGTASTNVTP